MAIIKMRYLIEPGGMDIDFYHLLLILVKMHPKLLKV